MKKVYSPFWRLTITILLVTLACSLPGKLSPTPASTPTALATSAIPLPPAVIETSPSAGSQIPLDGLVTIYFNQAMERTSVESALSVQPSAVTGQLTWKDDATLVFTPDGRLPAASQFGLQIGQGARAANGLGLLQPVSLDFQTPDYLRPTQFLPKPDSEEVIPNAAIVAAFNQPVVPLGADPAALPAAFSIQPDAQGKGEWLNTSTYIFYPDPALSGGLTYTVSLNPDLTANSGSQLAQSDIQTNWSFTTALPAVDSIDPLPEQLLGLDPKIKITFNQPMDQASLESGLQFTGPFGNVPGKFSWSDDGTSVSFQPTILLSRSRTYTLDLDGQTVRGVGGTPLGQDQKFTFNTYANFSVTASVPSQGEVKEQYDSVKVFFGAPVQDGNLDQFVSITPQVLNSSPYTSDNSLSLLLGGMFEPSTDYTLTISGSLKDRWGQALGSPFTLNFKTPPASPDLTLPYFGASMFFVRPEQPVLNAQATNIPRADLTIAPLSLADFFSVTGQNSYDTRQAYAPKNAHTIFQSLKLTSNQAQTVALTLTNNNEKSLPTGLYYVKVDAQQLEYHRQEPYFVVSSDINLTFKAGASDALVWAVDLRSGQPLANTPVSIYDNDGGLLVSGQTDAQGLWQTSIPERIDPYASLYAVIGAVGQDNFSLAMSIWDSGIAPWDFGLSGQVTPPQTEIYLYSDRPIYRPGQTVYFRGVVREAFNGRYTMPEQNTIDLSISDGNGQELNSFSLPLSAYGTLNGQYTLPADAAPGYYSITNKKTHTYFSFQVADYRKPEINLSVELSPEQIQTGQTPQATVNARYFFDAPAGNLPVTWTLYTTSASFRLPQYRVGPIDSNWMLPYNFRTGGNFGKQIAEGEGRTGADGTLSIQLSDLPEFDSLQNLTLEVIAQDESGAQISARSSMLVHPTDFYIGLRPDQWVGQAGTALGFDVLSVDWNQKSLGGKSLVAEFSQVTWERKDPPLSNQYAPPSYEPVYTPVGSTNLVTGPDGKARLSFTPPQAGTYILDVQGGGAKSQVLLWVGGKSQAVWPNLPNQHIEMTADRESYQPGQTAQIFIPNPLGGNTQALVTVERGVVLSAQVINLGPSGTTFSLPLTSEQAPNVFVSATLIGANNNFRQGYLSLPVAPEAQTLKVELTSQPQRSEPGGEVVFNLRVTDSQGKPVQGEFSLSVVDLAALALADPNAPDIVPAFYGLQPLGIETGVSLAAYSGRLLFSPGGIGGGGGDGAPTTVVRENFPDTAYWNPTLVTDANGRGQVTVTLPDNLTTWQVDVRGLTADTRVGQAGAQIVTSKQLLVRPVTPRFLVLGDHIEMAAIIHNNTSNDLQATVSLQALGFLLDDPAQLTQTINIPAGGRTRVAWWGTAQEAEAAELIFSAQAGDLQDSTRPVWGSLPILRYTAPQSFVTAGTLPEAGTSQELVSIPRSFVPTGGGLSLELSPSLAATILSSLEAIKTPPAVCSIETLASYFLANLETYQALETAGLEAPELKSRLQTELRDVLTRLLQRQNEDGGWGWWVRGKSDPYLSAYVLFGLGQAQDNGFPVNATVIQKARDFLTAARPYLGGTSLSEDDLSDLVLIEFVLGQTGGAESQAVEALYEARDQLAPWGQALLVLTMEGLNPTDPRGQDMIGALETSALRTASGAHWESVSQSWFKPNTALFNTAAVVYALAQRDPATPVMSDAVRYLVTQRNAAGLWGSSYDSAWIILALTKAMEGSGDLQANYSFNAALNGTTIASGQASGPQSLTTITSQIPLASLDPLNPNELAITHEPGNGKLYYRAALQVNQEVEAVKPLVRGLQVSRVYFDGTCQKDCTPIASLALTTGAKLTAQVTINLPHEAYYLMVDDFIPSGTEILDQSLKTSQQGEQATSAEVYAPDNPFAKGWGWWLFGNPTIYDDHIQWAADYLPAGTYVLTYTLIPLQAGQFRVLPAHAWQAFFPEVQGTSAGTVFEIKP
jgi:uncharacterized protein YfaS (alpha-2-macroglobulin family)